MRFLLLTQYYPPEVGAAQARLSAMVRELVRAGHEAEVVTAVPNYPGGAVFPGYGGKFYMREAIDEVQVHRTWLFATTGVGVRRLVSYLSFCATSLFGMAKAQKPDVIVVESPPLFLGISAVLASKLWRVPLIVNLADLWPDSVRAFGIMEDGFVLRSAARLEAWLYRRAAAVSAVTEGIRARLISEKELDPKKVLFLPNGVDSTVYRPADSDPAIRSELDLPPGPLLVYAGTHGHAHGLDVLLDAARLTGDTAATFVLVGDGSEKQRLQTVASDMGLTNVEFRDPQSPETIARLYAESVAGLSTLRHSELSSGTRPVKVLAIMSCARPVIYAGVGEGADIVADSSAGLVIPPDDPAALAEAVRSVLAAQSSQLNAWGSAGRAYVLTHLQWPALVDSWLRQLGGQLGD